MIEYGWARPDEEAELLDFGNLVFSLSHSPTDFSKIHPRVYSRPGFSEITRVARLNGKVIGMVAAIMGTLMVGGSALKYGYIGTVSTHPYHREKGIMKQLMPQVMAHLKEVGCDFVALDGQRQRYMHYGFEDAGNKLGLVFTGSSLKHIFGQTDKDRYRFIPFSDLNETELDFCHSLYSSSVCFTDRSREDFPILLRTWEGKAFLVKEGEENLGYLYVHHGRIAEYRFKDEGVLPSVIAAYLANNGEREVELTLFEPQLPGKAALFSAADEWKSGSLMKLCVLNWQRVLETFLALKTGYAPLREGSAVLSVTGAGNFRIQVGENRVSVSECAEQSDFSMNPLDAIGLVFLPAATGLYPKTPFENWFPLPLMYSDADAF